MASSVRDGALAAELRRALYHLYDPAELRRNGLVGRFGLEQNSDPASALRRLLTEAIEALKPAPSVPAHANAWRIYHVLFQRFSEQFTQREVATDLGLSIRQLRRLEASALGLLAERLQGSHPQTSPAAKALPPAVDEPGTPSREQELDWLRRSQTPEAVELAPISQAVLKTIGPLTSALHVDVDLLLPSELPPLAVPATPLRQALVNLLTTTVRCVPGGRVRVEIVPRNQQVQFTLHPQARGRAPASLEDQGESLDMARQLVSLCGGTLEVLPGANPREPYRLRAGFRAAGQVPVLVVDDNADTLLLLERYLSGSRYRLIGAPDPQQTLALAEQTHARIVILDVMLPGVDGWELLGRLREHPATRNVPVVVCTILPQEQLAEGLGAAAFLRKPLGRRELLETLDQLTEQTAGS